MATTGVAIPARLAQLVVPPALVSQSVKHVPMDSTMTKLRAHFVDLTAPSALQPSVRFVLVDTTRWPLPVLYVFPPVEPARL